MLHLKNKYMSDVQTQNMKPCHTSLQKYFVNTVMQHISKI